MSTVTTAPLLVTLRLDQLDPNAWNPNEMAPGARAELVREVERLGRITKPIVVRRQGDGFEIVDGEHSWRAAKKAGLVEVTCEIISADDFESMLQTYKRNQHGSHNPLRQGQMFARMKEQKQLSNRELAAAMGVSEGTVRNSLCYMEAQELRKPYAGDDEAGEIASLTHRQVKMYLTLPREIRDRWLDAGAPERLPDLTDRFRYEPAAILVQIAALGLGAETIERFFARRRELEKAGLDPDELNNMRRIEHDHLANEHSGVLFADDEVDDSWFERAEEQQKPSLPVTQQALPADTTIAGLKDQPTAPTAAPAPETAATTIDRTAMTETEARIVKELATPGALATCASKNFGGRVTPAGFKTFVDGVLKDAGAPADPLEIMLIEQLVLAHHVIHDLLAKAAGTPPETGQMLYSAATRLMGEYRKGALAVKEYRAPQRPPQVAIVNQPAVNLNHQSPSPTSDRNGHGGAEEIKNGHTKLGSNNGHTFNRIVNFQAEPEPAPCSCGADQPTQKEGALN